MSDPLRTDPLPSAQSEHDAARDAKIESLLLALLAGGLGLVLAAWSRGLLAALQSPYLPPGLKNVGPDNTNLQDDTAVERFIEIAGFQDIKTVKFDLPATFESPDQWRRWSMSVGQRAWWEQIPAGEHEALIERAKPVLESVHGPGKPFTLTQTIRLTVAYRSL